MPAGAHTCELCRGKGVVYTRHGTRPCPRCNGAFAARERARVDAEQSLANCAWNLRRGKGSRWNLERQVRGCHAKYGTSIERLMSLTELSRRDIRSIIGGQESLGV